MTTRCPFLINLTAVSTMRESIDSSGSCVFSWTIELEPVENVHQPLGSMTTHVLHTQFNHNGEMSVALHAYLFRIKPLAIGCISR